MSASNAMTTANAIRWFSNVEMDAPELRSPLPCPRGNTCNFSVLEDGKLVSACCRFVHPGEGGSGRRFYEEKVTDGTVLKACVRLTGCHKDAGGGYYARRKARMSWRSWAQTHNLPWSDQTAAVTLLTMGGKPLPPSKQPVLPPPKHQRQPRLDLTVDIDPVEPMVPTAEPLPEVVASAVETVLYDEQD